MLTRCAANPAVSTARARRNPTVRDFRDRIRPGSGPLTHRPAIPYERLSLRAKYPAKSRQGVRPWQVAGSWVDVCKGIFAYLGRATLRVLAGRPVLRTVSVAVRAIRRPGAGVHGHMADSVGAANVILQHLRRSVAVLRCRKERTVKPKLRPIRQASSGLSWSFTGCGRVAFWLLQGERDRGAEKLEGVPLDAGRLGEHRDGDLGAGVPDLVAGQGGQVVQQAAEAAVGLPGRVVLV